MATKNVEQAIYITPPKFKILELEIYNDPTSPHVQHRFSEKAKRDMHDKMEKGSTAKKGKREKRDFQKEFEESYYQTKNGDYGIPATAFRNAIVNACRVTGFPMRQAKLCIFIIADDIDAKEPIPLCLFENGAKPVYNEIPSKVQNKGNLAVNAMFTEWRIKLKVQYDADQFTENEIANLVMRAGIQVGVGEGRPFSKTSCGMGWGTFKVKGIKI